MNSMNKGVVGGRGSMVIGLFGLLDQLLSKLRTKPQPGW